MIYSSNFDVYVFATVELNLQQQLNMFQTSSFIITFVKVMTVMKIR